MPKPIERVTIMGREVHMESEAFSSYASREVDQAITSAPEISDSSLVVAVIVPLAYGFSTARATAGGTPQKELNKYLRDAKIGRSSDRTAVIISRRILGNKKFHLLVAACDNGDSVAPRNRVEATAKKIAHALETAFKDVRLP